MNKNKHQLHDDELEAMLDKLLAEIKYHPYRSHNIDKALERLMRDIRQWREHHVDTEEE